MRKILWSLACIILISCSKKSDNSTPATPTGFSVQVKKNKSLSPGQIVENDVPSIILVWKADGRDFDPSNSSSNILGGYLYDKTAGTAYKYDYGENDIISKSAPAGKYFVYVQLSDNGDVGRLAYSYTYFNVTKGSYTMLKKVFTTHVVTAHYEDWNAVE